MTDSTGIFTVGAKPYVSTAARRLLATWWWLPTLLAAALLIAGTFDNRDLYLCLMLVFIVYPSAMSLSWLALAARPAMRWCPRPQHIESAPDGGITVVFHAYPTADKPVGDEVARLTVDAADLDEAERHGTLLQVPLSKPNRLAINFLLIPAEAVYAATAPTPEI